MTEPVAQPNSSGIDIGASKIAVAVPAKRDTEPARIARDIHTGLIVLADLAQAVSLR